MSTPFSFLFNHQGEIWTKTFQFSSPTVGTIIKMLDINDRCFKRHIVNRSGGRVDIYANIQGFNMALGHLDNDGILDIDYQYDSIFCHSAIMINSLTAAPRLDITEIEWSKKEF